MKSFFYTLAFLSIFFFSQPAESAFIEGFEDLPLAEGLTQIEKGSLSFGNEEIRLIERYLTSNTISFSEVKNFYEETLPQLGWQPKEISENKISFERDGEILEIGAESVSPLIVRLMVKSKN